MKDLNEWLNFHFDIFDRTELMTSDVRVMHPWRHTSKFIYIGCHHFRMKILPYIYIFHVLLGSNFQVDILILRRMVCKNVNLLDKIALQFWGHLPPKSQAAHQMSLFLCYQRYQNENSTIHSHLPCAPWVKFTSQYLNFKEHKKQ